MYYAIILEKTKALISGAVSTQLICIFVSAYAGIRFSHDVAHELCHNKNAFKVCRNKVTVVTAKADLCLCFCTGNNPAQFHFIKMNLQAFSYPCCNARFRVSVKPGWNSKNSHVFLCHSSYPGKF